MTRSSTTQPASAARGDDAAPPRRPHPRLPANPAYTATAATAKSTPYHGGRLGVGRDRGGYARGPTAVARGVSESEMRSHSPFAPHAQGGIARRARATAERPASEDGFLREHDFRRAARLRMGTILALGGRGRDEGPPRFSPTVGCGNGGGKVLSSTPAPVPPIIGMATLPRFARFATAETLLNALFDDSPAPKVAHDPNSRPWYKDLSRFVTGSS